MKKDVKNKNVQKFRVMYEDYSENQDGWFKISVYFGTAGEFYLLKSYGILV